MSDELHNIDIQLNAQLSALQIYNNLIMSCRAEQSKRLRIHFNELTGIQKIFLDGKLIHIKHVRYSPPATPPEMA